MFVLTQRPAKLFRITPQHPRNQTELHGAFCWGRHRDLDRDTFDAPDPVLRGGGECMFHRTLEVLLCKGEGSLFKMKKIKKKK